MKIISVCFSGKNLNQLHKTIGILVLFFFFQKTSVLAQIPAYIDTTGLIAWYSFAGNANDSSGHNYNGTVNGGATLTTDRFGNANSAYSFNGSTSYIQLPMKQTNISQWSIAAWVKTDSTGVILQGGNYGSGVDVGITMRIDGWSDGFDHSPEICSDGAGYQRGLYSGSAYSDNNWHHIVGVWDGIAGTNIDSAQFSIYIDGNLVSTYIYGNSVGHGGSTGPQPAPLSPSGNMVIGRHSIWGQYYYGVLDDIGLWNRALTSCEVYKLFHSSTALNAGTITGSSNVCVGSSIVLADTTLGGLWSSSNAGIATVGTSGIITGVSFGTVIISYVVTNSCGSTYATKAITVDALISSIPASGLVAWYPFNGTANDESGNGLNGTVSGASLTTDRFGQTNSAYSFNGSTDYIEIPYNSLFDNSQYSFSFWLKTPLASYYIGGPGVNQGIISRTAAGGPYLSAGASDPWVIFEDDGGCALATAGCGGSPCSYNANAFSASNTISDNSWHHIVFTVSSNLAICYKDGVNVNSNFFTAGITYQPYATRIGRCLHTYWRAFEGNVDDIAIYNRVLSPEEVTQLYSISFPYFANITGSSSLCVGYSATLADTITGGTWSSSNSAVATIGTSGIVNGISPGTVTISYTVTNSCGSAVATKTINVLPTSLPSITGPSSMCIGTPATFANTVGGGTWSSSNTAIAVVGSTSGIITGIAAGTVTISYIVPGCTGNLTKTKSITVKDLPSVPDIGGNTTAICPVATFTLTETVTGTHTWISSNTSIATVNSSSGVVKGIAGGTATISYSYKPNGCTNYATTIVTVNPVTVPTITGTLTLCKSGGTTLLSGSPEGGIWSSSSVTRASVGSSSGLVTGGNSNGSATITYAYTNDYGCSANATKSVTVNALPGVATIGGTSSLAVGATGTVTDATAGGTWSSSNTAVATIGTSGTITGISAGTCVITYTVTDTNGCSAFKTKTITVHAAKFSISPVENNNDFIFQIYPNPTTGIFTITTSVKGTLIVYTIDGKEISNYQISVGSATFNLPADIANGLYICRYHAENGAVITQRLTYMR